VIWAFSGHRPKEEVLWVARVTRFGISCVLPTTMDLDGGDDVTVEAEELKAPGESSPDALDGAFRESFEAFYGRELHSVIGLAYVLSGSRSAAEDLAQDAFLVAFRHWDRVASYDDPGGWVRRVLVNRTRSGFRRRTAEIRALARLRDRVFDVPEVPAEAAETWEAVRRLPVRQAQVIALRYYDQRSIKDIARILDRSENTVKTHLQRARHALAELFGEEANNEDT